MGLETAVTNRMPVVMGVAFGLVWTVGLPWPGQSPGIRLLPVPKTFLPGGDCGRTHGGKADRQAVS